MFFKNNFFIAFATFFCLSTTADAQVIEHWKNGNRKSETQYTEDFSYSTKWYENSGKMSEGTMRYEKRVGTWRFWHENGKPQLVMFYDSLATDLIKASSLGIVVRITSYNNAGQLERVENYSDGLPFVNSEYYTNGQLKQIVNYDKGTAISGIRWFENGSINEMFSFQKVYKTDNVAGKEVIKLDTEKLTFKEWFDNGKVLLNGQVDTEGRKAGVWYQYDKYGNVLQTIEN